MSTELKKFFPIAQAIEKLLHPYAEVVIHDIKKNKIVALFNNFSKRKVGEDSSLEQKDLPKSGEILGPYEKINWDGKRLKSISSFLRDQKGKSIGLLCINLDISVLEKYQTLIDTFINKNQLSKKPEVLFKDDWRERINQYIHHYLAKYSLSLSTLTAEEKRKVILFLQTEGAFKGKNAANYISQILNVSRATVYNYLKR